MQLTRAGEVFLPEAELLLQHKHRLERFAETLSANYVQNAQLGIIHPIDAAKVGTLTKRIVQQQPNTQLHIQYGMSGEILSRLLGRKLHGGFFLGHIDQRSLQIHWLEDISYELICSTEYVETVRTGLPKSLNDFTWVEMSGVSGSYKHLQQFWHRHKLSPKKQIICDYPQTIIDLVAAQMGLAIVPKHAAQAAIALGKNIAIIEEFEQKLPLNFIYLDELSEDPALELLRENVLSVWDV